MVVGDFTDRAGFQQLLPGAFGSQEWLGTENDGLLLDNSSRGLAGVGLYLLPSTVYPTWNNRPINVCTRASVQR